MNPQIQYIRQVRDRAIEIARTDRDGWEEMTPVQRHAFMLRAQQDVEPPTERARATRV